MYCTIFCSPLVHILKLELNALYIFKKEDLSDLSDLSFHSASNRSDNEGGLSDVETREDPTFSFASGNPENQNPQTNETIPYLAKHPILEAILTASDDERSTGNQDNQNSQTNEIRRRVKVSA